MIEIRVSVEPGGTANYLLENEEANQTVGRTDSMPTTISTMNGRPVAKLAAGDWVWANFDGLSMPALIRATQVVAPPEINEVASHLVAEQV